MDVPLPTYPYGKSLQKHHPAQQRPPPQPPGFSPSHEQQAARNLGIFFAGSKKTSGIKGKVP